MIDSRRTMRRGYAFVSIPVDWLNDRPYSTLHHAALGAYLRLYLLAGVYNQGGALMDERGPLEVQDIAYLLRCDAGELDNTFGILEMAGLMCCHEGVWRVEGFASEQVDLNTLRSEWRKRQQKHRDNELVETELKVEVDSHMLVTCDSHVTPATAPMPSSGKVVAERIQTFSDRSGLPIPASKRECDEWLKADAELERAGVEPADVIQAVDYCRQQGFRVTGFRSIVKPAKVAMTQRKNGNGRKERAAAEEY